jgi:hypothetical protein
MDDPSVMAGNGSMIIRASGVYGATPVPIWEKIKKQYK